MPAYDPAAIAGGLRAAVAEALALFASMDEDLSRVRPRPDAWCAREIVGHLIDSACNNHRRFVIGQSPGLPPFARFDAYEQDLWVSRQHYADESWTDLVTLWAAYNRHLMHLMRHTTPAGAANGAIAPNGSEVVSVGFLMHDYVRHLRHHVDQVRSVAAGL